MTLPPPASPHLFSAEQWKALTSPIGSAKISNDRMHGILFPIDWIIDTGATHHITGEKPWLFDVEDVIDCLVAFSNGSLVTATHKDFVRLSTHFTLTNVLFVPKFSL